MEKEAVENVLGGNCRSVMIVALGHTMQKVKGTVKKNDYEDAFHTAGVTLHRVLSFHLGNLECKPTAKNIQQHAGRQCPRATYVPCSDGRAGDSFSGTG